MHALVGEYERSGDANVRWVASSEQIPELVRLLDEGRASHQGWIVALFEASLPSGASARRRTVLAAHAATDVYTWNQARFR